MFTKRSGRNEKILITITEFSKLYSFVLHKIGLVWKKSKSVKIESGKWFHCDNAVRDKAKNLLR